MLPFSRVNPIFLLLPHYFSTPLGHMTIMYANQGPMIVPLPVPPIALKPSHESKIPCEDHRFNKPHLIYSRRTTHAHDQAPVSFEG